jgi:PilZ domain
VVAMKLSDRRMAQRFSLAIPVYVSEWRSPATEKKVQSTNLSESGVYFETDTPPCEGGMLRLRLEVPKEITGGAPVKWCCTGKVMRVQSVGNGNASMGVGVRFDYYEIS